MNFARDAPQAGSGLRHGAAALLLLAAFSAVVVFLPAEGRIGAPLHDGVTVLLGQASFVLPLGLAFVGIVVAVRGVRPWVRLPRRRLAGVGLLCLGALPSQHLMSSGSPGTGLVGQWLSGWLLDLLGVPLTGLVLVASLACGVMLTFDARLRRAPRLPRAES